jgi:ATP-dependent Clp protease ATP-binding subunit ClpC
MRVSDKGLQTLRRRAEELASSRREGVTTAHLLAAVAELADEPASLLLLDRGLDAVRILEAIPTEGQDPVDSIGRTLQRARDFASRGENKAVGPLHVLFALCQERASGAHRILERSGIDVAKLRATVMQLAMGIVSPRRTTPITEPKVARTTIATERAPSAPTPLPLSKSPSTRPRPSAGPSPRPTIRPIASPKPARPTGAPPPSPPISEPLIGAAPSTPPALPKSILEEVKPSILAACTRALTSEGARAVIGREAEVERILDVLDRRDAHHAAIVGAPGIGKSSLVLALAAALHGAGSRVLELDPGALLAGSMARGAMTDRFARLRRELEALSGRTVLVVDGVASLLGADASEETVAEVRGLLARGSTRLVFTATPEEFKRHVECDGAMLRRMTAIELAELPRERVAEVVERAAKDLGAHHEVTVTDGARDVCVAWAERYVSERVFPDKALTILDLAAARAKRKASVTVDRSHVAQVVADLAAVPLERLLETDAERMLHLEQHLGRRVVGHGDALSRLAQVLRRSASGLRSDRPLGTFLLLGPTGVGKTETAKAVAECLFGSPHAMTRLDFSEYSESHAVARLVGAPPGYVGHDAGGQLTEAVRKRPYQVILLDEIEKAHRDVLEAFLQVFDEGRMTDGRGRTVDFRQTVILLTSNLGAEVFSKGSSRAPIGFGTASAAAGAVVDDKRSAALEKAKGALPPELVNRFDDILVFGALTESDVREVAQRMLRDLAARLHESRRVELAWSDALIDLLVVSGGYDAAYGARPMRRTIGRLIETPLAEQLLSGSVVSGGKLRLEVRDGSVQFTAKTTKERARERAPARA